MNWILEWEGGFSTVVPDYMVPPDASAKGYWYEGYLSACGSSRLIGALRALLEIE